MFGFETTIFDVWYWARSNYPTITFLAAGIFTAWYLNSFIKRIRKQHEDFWNAADSENWDETRNKERRERLIIKILMDIREVIVMSAGLFGTIAVGFIFYHLFNA